MCLTPKREWLSKPGARHARCSEEPTTTVVPQGKKPVTLKIGGDDEGEDAPVVSTTKVEDVVNSTTVNTVAPEDDIFKMAEDLING